MGRRKQGVFRYLAGILNAVVRNHGLYPDGVVLAVLAVNLLRVRDVDG